MPNAIMSHFDNSGSEDGQLRSPADDYMSEEGETADSLDIKPPQASRDQGRKKSMLKDRKHSRDHRHKDRDQILRGREKERRHHHSSSSSNSLQREREKHVHRREHERHERQHDYYSRHKDQREREKRMERGEIRERVEIRERIEGRERVDARERSRKVLEHVYEDKVDADRVLEDLRSRLLSKRNKYEATRYEGSSYEPNTRPIINEHKREKQNERRDNLVENIDSPEHYSDYTTSSSKRKSKKVSHEDQELIARRTKLLEADREAARRKELAREELEARRELRRNREDLIPSPTIKHKSRTKRRSSADDVEGRKRLKKSLPDDEFVDKTVVEVSDNTEDSSDEEEEVEQRPESDSGSDSGSESDKDSEKQRSGEDEDDDILPGSPLSVGELTKSDHGIRTRPRSRSPSPSRSRSQHTESPSKSRSRTRSRSRSRSLSRSRSRSERSATKSRSRTRSRSRSRSRSSSKSRSSTKEGEMNRESYEEDDKSVKPNEEIPKSEKDTAENKEAVDDSPRDEKGEKLPNYYPGIQGCRSVEEFQCLNRIEEGTYGVVYRAKDKRTNEIVALKRLKMEKEKEGFPITSLREINTLLKGQHPNIVTVREIVVGSNMDKIFIVMDYVEHDLKSLMETMKHKEQSFFPGEVKCLIQQLLRAVAHLHDNWILHRDLKTSNLLLSHKGILKVGDFGLAREYGSPLKAYTSLVVTLWYRAPELLLCSKEYSTPIDMWSVGCIFAEFLQMGPLFPGKSEIDQLNRIFKELGTPNEKIWPGYKELPAVQSLQSQNSHFAEYPVSNIRRRFYQKTTEIGLNLLQGLLTYDPKQRLTAEQALKSPYFKELPLPIDPSMFPTWPAKSELGARKALASSPKPPSGGSQFKQLGRDDIPSSNQTGFVLTGSIDKRQLTSGPGFNLKF